MAAKRAEEKAAAPAEVAASPDRPLKVSQLAAAVDGALRRGFPASVRVAGEVSGFRDRTHWYFDLKDENAVINGVMFRSAAAKAGFVPQNGQQVLARGRIEFYAPGGKVSFIIDKLEPVGEGALELAYRALCEELRGLGWFAVERKRPLPTFPRRIAVITSRTGAALQDVIDTMRRRCPAVGVLLVDARMQGKAAAPEVAAAIREVNARAEERGIDAIIVTRGGGSMEDLWAFNERIVSQAIFESQLPVVAAIGHETDTTIAELVADERCATPTQAAMRLTPDTEALLRQIDSMGRRLAGLVVRQVRAERQRVVAVARYPFFADPRGPIAMWQDRLSQLTRRMNSEMRAALLASRRQVDECAVRLEPHRPGVVHGRLLSTLSVLEARLNAAVGSRLDSAAIDAAQRRLQRAVPLSMRRSRERVQSAARRLEAVSPRRVLERGYTVTLRDDGRLVRSPADVRDGDRLETRTADGSVHSVVGEGSPVATGGSRPTEQQPPPPAAKPAAASRGPAGGRRGGRAAEQPNLFELDGPRADG